MFTDIVNNITFDFTCNNEVVAKNLQREIQNYTTQQISAIIENILEGAASDELKLIGKIEIDLGDIDEKNINTSILNKFRNLFDTEIRKASPIQYSNEESVIDATFNKTDSILSNVNLDFYSKGGADLNITSLSSMEAEFEVIKEFLLYGDIPWWASKNSLPDLDKIMQNSIRVQPQKITFLFEHLKKNKQVILRLKSQFSPTTLALMKVLIPEVGRNYYFNIEKSDFSHEVNVNDAFNSLQTAYYIERPDNYRDTNIDTSPHSYLDSSAIAGSDSDHPFTGELKRPGPEEPNAGHKVKINHSFDEDPAKHGVEQNYSLSRENISRFVDEDSTKRSLRQPEYLHTPDTDNSFISILSAFGKVFKNQKDPDKNLKVLLILQLMQRFDVSSFYKIRMLNVFSLKEITALYSYFIETRKNPLHQHSIINILQKLGFFQIEILLQPPNSGNEAFDMGALAKEQSADQSDAFKDPLRLKSVTYLLAKLENSENILSDELYKYPVDDLIRLEKLFKQYSLKNHSKIRLINLLIHHPFFIRYNLLQLPAKLSFDFDVSQTDKRLAKELNTYKTELTAVLNQLSVKHSVIINDVFAKGTISSDFEQKAIINVLQKLSVPGLSLISKFASLQEAQLKTLLYNNSELAKNDLQNDLSQIQLPFSSRQKTKKIIIENAGLCLVASYLPRLFNNLGYVEKKDFKSKIHRSRALFVLEYIATGRQRNPEYLMQLNKLLCGFRTEDWITGHKRLTTKEKNEADDLLSSVIANWEKLKGTSLNGLRTSFIQRKGLLFEEEKSWILQIERKGYDVLIDNVPWSFNLIKLPWMKKMIEVEW